ncbi:MAG: hypothetical protein H0X25_10410 [Acidobacteriales bacterium]|nr:hypothetical protein [Terriglobales bacterium]
MKSWWQVLIVLAVLTAGSSVASLAQSQGSGTVARMVLWRAKPGMTKQFEEGYQRHLEWHRKNHDSWNWYGWNIVSGERFGYFLDGSFFHTWAEMDSPVSPAGDSADSAVNVSPYAEILSVAMYESLPLATNFRPGELSASHVTFSRWEVQPGRAGEFESLLAAASLKSKTRHRGSCFVRSMEHRNTCC